MVPPTRQVRLTELAARRNSAYHVYQLSGLFSSECLFGDVCERFRPHGQLVADTEGVPNRTVFRVTFSHSVRMKRKELTPKQQASVACPTCGVSAGERCVLHSGGLRSETHLERKLVAIEAIEKS
jgi:hypothetical protein